MPEVLCSLRTVQTSVLDTITLPRHPFLFGVAMTQLESQHKALDAHSPYLLLAALWQLRLRKAEGGLVGPPEGQITDGSWQADSH